MTRLNHAAINYWVFRHEGSFPHELEACYRTDPALPVTQSGNFAFPAIRLRPPTSVRPTDITQSHRAPRLPTQLNCRRFPNWQLAANSAATPSCLPDYNRQTCSQYGTFAVRPKRQLFFICVVKCLKETTYDFMKKTNLVWYVTCISLWHGATGVG